LAWKQNRVGHHKRKTHAFEHGDALTASALTTPKMSPGYARLHIHWALASSAEN